MRIAITGHTRGIGASLAAYLRSSHEIIGFSRSNGFDIANAADRRDIIAGLDNVDIFLNNAAAGFHQSEMLFETWQHWHAKGKRARIISIGSRAGLRSRVNQVIQHPPMMYGFHKLMVNEMSRALSIIEPSTVKVTCLSFGFVDTPRMRALHPERQSWISLDYVNDVVGWLIAQPPAVNCPEMSIFDC